MRSMPALLLILSLHADSTSGDELGDFLFQGADGGGGDDVELKVVLTVESKIVSR